MRPTHALAALVLLVALAGCGGAASQSPSPSPSPAPPTEAAPGEPLVLRVGESAAVGELTLTLVAIENDSRCPSSVTCAWEGSAEAVVVVGPAGQAGETIRLTIYGRDRERDASRAQAGRHSLRLVALEPYPADPGPIPPGQYRATLIVEEGGYAVVRGAGFAGAIVPERDAPGLSPHEQGYWTPAEADVLAFEAGLGAFLEGAAPALGQRATAYTRQYAGLLRDGRRLLYASFLCDTYGEPWWREPLLVLDGGDCFFQLTFDLERGSYGNLMISGEA